MGPRQLDHAREDVTVNGLEVALSRQVTRALLTFSTTLVASSRVPRSTAARATASAASREV